MKNTHNWDFHFDLILIKNAKSVEKHMTRCIVQVLVVVGLLGWLLWEEARGCAMWTTEGSSQLQQTHHRTQLSLSAKCGTSVKRYLRKGRKQWTETQREQKEGETAEGTPGSENKEGEEVLQVSEQRFPAAHGEADGHS